MILELLFFLGILVLAGCIFLMLYQELLNMLDGLHILIILINYNLLQIVLVQQMLPLILMAT